MTHELFRLLVVDDEAIMRASLADILRLEGYLVDTAEGGEQAIYQITHQNYDLVLLDLKMPGLDGVDVLRHITRLTNGQTSIPGVDLAPTVIMLTAHGSLESAIEALRNGAHDYLLKPSSPEQILNSVAQALRVRSEQLQIQVRIKQLEQATNRVNGATYEKHNKGFGNLYRINNETTYDPYRREIKYNTEIISLTPTEGKLFSVFLDQPGHVFNHRELVMLVQGYETKDWEAPEVLRPLISRLRRKLSHLPNGISWITSVRGTGYAFDITIDGEKT